tara:strand:+ start:861 stop:1955 length:1095 start_codon:yes stop_codon:yes gene_type:complete
MENERKNPILYPPTIIGHITDHIADLFRHRVKGKDMIKVGYGCQLNGQPHLGTAISLMSTYALAEHLQEKLELPAEVVFGALENGPGEKREVDGILYQRMLCDIYEGSRSLADIHLDTFTSLLSELSGFSGVPHSIEMYKDLQAKPRARETLLELIAREKEFVPLLNPSDDRLRVRFKCPSCSYEEKHSRTLKILEHKPNDRIRFQSRCFDHGNYQITLSRDSGDFIDVNTMVRNVMKEAVLSEESRDQNYFPLVVKGADWMHAVVLVSNALELLGYSFLERPSRIATPMIEDWSGAKFSKSVYIKSGTYESLPQEFVSLSRFVQKFGQEGFKDLWSHVSSWVKDPKKFYRNYSLDYLREVFDK